MVQTAPQPPQLFTSLAVLAHVPLLQSVGALAGQPSVHAYWPAIPCAHGDMVPAQLTPHAPQFDADPKFVPQPVPASAQSA